MLQNQKDVVDMVFINGNKEYVDSDMSDGLYNRHVELVTRINNTPDNPAVGSTPERNKRLSLPTGASGGAVPRILQTRWPPIPQAGWPPNHPPPPGLLPAPSAALPWNIAPPFSPPTPPAAAGVSGGNSKRLPAYTEWLAANPPLLADGSKNEGKWIDIQHEPGVLPTFLPFAFPPGAVDKLLKAAQANQFKGCVFHHILGKCNAVSAAHMDPLGKLSHSQVVSEQERRQILLAIGILALPRYS
jgi:hypothetical protein